jgi:manganese/zinc/iron transport system permease protein
VSASSTPVAPGDDGRVSASSTPVAPGDDGRVSASSTPVAPGDAEPGRTVDAGAAPRRRRRAAPVAIGALLVALIGATALAQDIGLFGHVLVLLSVVAAASAVVGTWLVLRSMAMMADAIAHAILFGIVAVLWVVARTGGSPLADLSSPLFIVGAGLAGVLTVFLVETLLATRLVREDAAIGMVFSLLFSLGLVVIALYFRDAHVDEHLVLAGGVEITVLRQVVIRDLVLSPPWSAVVGGIVQRLAPPAAVTVWPDLTMRIDGWQLGPRALWTMAAVLAADLAFVGLLWKELKLTTFDAALAASLGLAPVAVNYALMALVSVTAVGAFEAVGSIIAIALFVAPPATAWLLTDDLFELVVLAVVIALAATWLGFALAVAADVSFGGAVAVAAGGLFLAALLFAPRQGLVGQWLRREAQRRTFALDTLLVHLAHHAGTDQAGEETAIDRLPAHLRWTRDWTDRTVGRAERHGLVERTGGCVTPTEAGRARAAAALARAGGGA